MKALVYTGPNELVYRDEPEPIVRDGDALIEIDAVGICGSDMHAYHGKDPRRIPPLILGHEVAGRVRNGPRAGTPVILNPLVTCGVCDDCSDGRQNLCRDRKLIGMNTPGGFAEQITIPQSNLIPIPSGMDCVHASLAEPTATALHAIRLAERAAARPLREGNALVIGAGAIGLLAALALRNAGVQRIVVSEPNPLRRKSATEAGVAEVHDPASGSLPDDEFALVFDGVGMSATRRTALAAVRPGGVIMHVGLGDGSGEADFRKLTLSEITLIGTYTYTPLDVRAALQALHDGALGDLCWVARRPLAEGAMAFSDLDAGRHAAGKIVLTP